MNRRAFVGALAAVLPLTAGCAGDTESGADRSPATTGTLTTGQSSTPTVSATEAPPSVSMDVAVTYRYGSGYTGRGETLDIDPSGRLTYIYDCGQLLTDTGDGGPREGALTRTEADRLERLVEATEPASWADHYDCDEPCPTDTPTPHVTLTVDGSTYETGVDPTAEIPDPLDELIGFLRAQAETFEESCR